MADLELAAKEFVDEISRLSTCVKNLEERLAKLEEQVANSDGTSKISSYAINCDELIESLGISKHTLYGWVSKRIIPHYKVGKKLYFNSDEIVEFIKKRKSKSNDEIEADSMAYVAKNKGASPKHRKSKWEEW